MFLTQVSFRSTNSPKPANSSRSICPSTTPRSSSSRCAKWWTSTRTVWSTWTSSSKRSDCANRQRATIKSRNCCKSLAANRTPASDRICRSNRPRRTKRNCCWIVILNWVRRGRWRERDAAKRRLSREERMGVWLIKYLFILWKTILSNFKYSQVNRTHDRPILFSRFDT